MDDFARAEAAIDRFDIGYVVFNDHLPHQRLAEGRKPPRLTGQALKSGRSPDAHLALMQDLHARSHDVPAALDALTHRLAQRGVVMGSHDDSTALGSRRMGGARGTVSEFPETVEAAEAARADGAHIVLGAPNVVRGASHAGNIAASELIHAGLCDALASDYHYPSPLRGAFRLEELGICDLAQAWRLVSSGPARLLGLDDRGELTPGKRADLIVVDPDTRRVVATIAGGRGGPFDRPGGTAFPAGLRGQPLKLPGGFGTRRKSRSLDVVHMAHFATRLGFGLAVEVQRGVRQCGQFRHAVHVVTDQVLHHHIGMALAIAQAASR